MLKTFKYKIPIKQQPLRSMWRDQCLLARYATRGLSIALISLFSIMGSQQAQAQAEDFAQTIRVKERLSKSMNDEISRYFDQADFQVILDFDINMPGASGQEGLPYLPGGNQSYIALLGDHLSEYEIISKTNNLRVTIKFSDKYKDYSRDFVRDLLKEKFGIGRKGRKDKVIFKEFKIDRPMKREELNDEIAKRDAEIRQKNDQIIQKDNEIGRKDSELTRVTQAQGLLQNQKSNLEERIERQKEDKEEKLGDLRGKVDSLQKKLSDIKDAQQGKPFIEQYQNYLISVIALLAVMFGAFIVSAAIRTFGNHLSGAVEKFSQSLRSQGGGASTIDTDARTISSSQVSSGFGLPDDRSTYEAHSPSKAPTWSIDDMENRLVTLQKEIETMYSTESDAVIATYITRLMSRDDVETAVVIMEFLGKDAASAIYQQLSQNLRSRIYHFLKEGLYSQNKLELLMDAGEMIKSQLIGARMFGKDSEFDEALRQAISELSLSSMIDVVTRLNGDQLVRFLSYLELNQLVRILDHIDQEDRHILDAIVDALARLPDAKNMKSHDRPILNTVNETLNATTGGDYINFQSFYKNFLETTSDDVASQLSEKLANVEVMKHYLDNEVILFADFQDLKSEIQDEILSQISLKEVATLLDGLTRQQSQLIFQRFDETEQLIIQDEINQLNSMIAYRKKAGFKKIRDKITNIMRNINRDVPLKELKNNDATSSRGMLPVAS